MFIAAWLASGCAVSRGNHQDETPPRLVTRGKTVAWDRGEAFGPVPLQLASLAAMHCASLNTQDVKWQVEGFHARAQDFDGKTFPGGGYFCKPRQRSN
ncbi:MAG: hypothetical protein Q8S02_07365 [Hydrogenophaga sp.]|nr:hypothetical protein [Hydrogenophaga sp.]